jgi:hypothetical protein
VSGEPRRAPADGSRGRHDDTILVAELIWLLVRDLVGASCAPARCSRTSPEGPDWPGLKQAVENMKSIRTEFTCAAKVGTSFAVFDACWMMVFAIAIVDDSERREKERRKKRSVPPAVG